MKKIILYLIFSLSTITLMAQTESKPTENEIGQINNAVHYRLFPTQNMWTFIKLNTRNGQMWQVQYSMESVGRMVTYLNNLPLITEDKEENDRFTLYPTQNVYTFILLDQIDGKTWQVQWSLDLESRVVIPIE